MSAPPATTDGPRLGSRAVRALLWAVAGFGSNKLIAFIGTLVLARVLTPAEFGIAAAAIALLTYVEMILDLGVGSAVVYEQEEGVTERVWTAFTLNVALGAALAGMIALTAPVAAAFFRSPEQTGLFRFLAVFVLIRAAGQVPDALLRRDLDFRRRMIVGISRAAVRVSVAIPLAVAGYGAWSIVIGMTLGEVAATLATWHAARFRPRLRFDRLIARSLLGYSSVMLLMRLVSEVANNGDYLIVGNRLGPDQLGVYSIAFRVPELLLVTGFWIYSSVAFPVYSRAHRSGELGELRRTMLRATRLTTMFAFPAGVGLAIVAHDAVHVLFTDRWAAAVVPMTIIALALAIDAVPIAASDVLPAAGRPGTLLRVNVTVGAPTLTAMVLVAPHGLVAIALVSLVGSVLFLPLLQREVNRVLGSRWREVAVATGPALAVAAGVVAGALPVRLLLEPGVARLAATIVCGVLGAAVGLLLGGRSVLPELRSVVHHVRGG
jgi:lipopolysaccharide exporter